MRADLKLDAKLLQIALSIGWTSEPGVMLTGALSAMRKALGCHAGVAALFEDNPKTGHPFRATVSLPKGFDSRPVFRDFLDTVYSPGGNGRRAKLIGKIPCTLSSNARGHAQYAHFLPLAGTGLLVLFTRDKPLGSRTIAALSPLTARLASAIVGFPFSGKKSHASRQDHVTREAFKKSRTKLSDTLRTVRKTQEELRTSKNHLALILQSLGEGVVVVGRDFRVIVMNVKAMEYLDFAQSDKEVITIDDLFSRCEGDKAAIRSFILDDSDDETVLEVTVHGPHTPNRILGISKNHIRYVFNKASEIILSLRDITREKEVDRLKNEFISNLSHELRTPMNAILGVSKLLSRKNTANLNERQKEGLGIIYSSGQRLLSLINDLLDLSKIEAGKMDMIEEPFPLSGLMGDLDSFTRALAGEKNISIEISVDAQVPATLVYDQRRLLQVLTNIMSNAVKFTEEGRIELSVFTSEGALFFKCTDTGIGISSEELPYIFDRFRQLDGSASRKYSGSGLGLSLSRDLVTLMGGEIYARSTKGRGTEVTFHLPLHAHDGSQDTAPLPNARPGVNFGGTPSPGPGGRALVLVADDESSTREMIAMVLDSRYELHFAADGREAVELFERLQPGMVLMDIMMPGMDGHQALKMIRGKPGGADVPVIAITARAMKGEREHILMSGFDAYVSKPIDDEDLIRQMVFQFERQGKRNKT